MKPLLSIGAGLVDCLAYVSDGFLNTIVGAKGGMELIDADTLHDILGRLPEPPVLAPGGSAANTAAGYGRLGGKAGMLAKVGCDERAAFYRDSFIRSSVDTSRFKISEAMPTGTCVSMITPDSERTMRTCLGASETLGTADIGGGDFHGYEHVHVEGYLLFNRDLILHVLEQAKAAGCSVSLDLASPEVVAGAKDILPRLLRDFVDMAFANEAEAAMFCGSENPAVGLDALSELCDLAVVKLGADGAMIRRGDETARVSAMKVNAVDTTGAGDIWAAGFLFGVLSGGDLEHAGLLGARLGAEVVQVTGAVLDDQAWDKIKRIEDASKT